MPQFLSCDRVDRDTPTDQYMQFIQMVIYVCMYPKRLILDVEVVVTSPTRKQPSYQLDHLKRRASFRPNQSVASPCPLSLSHLSLGLSTHFRHHGALLTNTDS